MTIRGMLAAVLLVVMSQIGCSTERSSQLTQAVTASPAAAKIVSDLRGRFVLHYATPPGPDTAEDKMVTRTEAVFVTSEVDRVQQTGSRLSPVLKKGVPPGLTLPDRAAGAIELTSGGVTARVSLVGAAPNAIAELGEGYIVYANGAPGGGHVLHLATNEGVEDFVTFASAPQTAAVQYSVELAQGVAGLRLVENTLELLDGDGAPRLRVRPPYLVDATGKGVAASLSVSGCAFDTDPRAPWGRAVAAAGASKCTVQVSWNNGDVTYPAVLDPSWSTTGNMTQARADHTLTLLDDGKVLAAAGINSAPQLPAAELYNPASGTWASTGNPKKKRTNHIAVKLTNGKVLMAGGINGSTVLNVAELYNPATGTWSNTGSMATARRVFVAERLSNGKVLAAGGYTTGGGVVASAELYDPSSATWSGTGSMSAGRAGHRSSVMNTFGRVLVSGGSDGASYLASAESYSESAGTWSGAGSMSSARAAHGQTILPYGNKVMVAGGTSNGTNSLNSVEIYDPYANTWRSAPSMSTGRKNSAAFLLHDSEVLFAGGETSAGYTSSAELYAMVPEQTATTVSMASARSRYGIARFSGSNTKALVAGGYNGTSYLTAAELFDVANPLPPGGTDNSEGWSPPRMTVTWDSTQGLTGSFATSYTVAATVSNNDSVSHNAYVDLVAIGLDDRVVTRSAYFDVSLAAGATTQVNIPASAFPIEPVGSEAQLMLRLRPYDPVGGPTGEDWEVDTPLFYEFNADFAQVIFHGADGADLDRTQPGASATYAAWLTSTSTMRSGLANVTGKVWTAGGGFVDVSSLPPAPHGRHAMYSMRGQWAKDLETLWPSITPDYIAPGGSLYYKFCANWQVSYDDVGYGETYLATKGLQYPKAAWANYILLGPNNATVSKGVLNSQGCTPEVLLGTNETFQFTFAPWLTRNTTTLKIENGPNGMWCNPVPPYPCYPSNWLIPMYMTSLSTLGDGSSNPSTAPAYDNNNSINEFVTRASAVLGLALGLTDNGLLPSTTYHAYANTGCFADVNGAKGEACGTPGGLYLGRSFNYVNNNPVANGRHTSYSKYTIAHEFGHTQEQNLFGILRFSLGTCTNSKGFNCQQADDGLPAVNANTESFCRCDYVKSGNQYHCLQSKETQSFADNEGYGHFYGANLFNDTTTAQCTFVYYKTSLTWPIWALGYVETAPPTPFPCYYTVPAGQKWMKNQCNTMPTKKGVEWDWLTFLYELHNKTSNAYTFDDIRQTYEMACTGGSGFCVYHSVFFDEAATGSSSPGSMHLVASANAVFGTGSQKANHLLNTGTKHGVNNN